MGKLRSPFTFAGVLALVGAAFPLVVWFTYLFTSTPASVPIGKAALDQLAFSFSSESAAPWAFAILAALPILCLAIAFAYLLGFASSPRRVHALFGATAMASVGAIALNDWSLVFILAASAYCGWRGLNVASQETPSK